MSDFNKLDLHVDILKTIAALGYELPTPIQQKAIPPLLQGKDILGIAQTGTGKTAAFALPIIQNLAKNRQKTRSYNIRALILTPTRELASQINNSFREYGENMKLYSGVIFGGVGKKGQINIMSKGCDILVATPGRLLDLMSENYIRFDQLEIFVLDEADRMLDMGFIHDIKKIIARLPKQRQTMLFSATMPKTISSLANSLLTNPVKVEITPESTTVEKIDQKVNMVERTNKIHLLKNIFSDQTIESALVFTRTKHGADRVAKELEKNNVKTATIHGNKSQGARERALKSFKKGDARVLIATDIAARGIDIDRVTHVINFDLPEEAENYVHRIGRTARAGRDGASISFCDATEVKFLKNIQKFIRYTIPVDIDHEYHVTYSAAQIASEELEKKQQAKKRIQQRSNSRNKSRTPSTRKSASGAGAGKKRKPASKRRF